MPAPRRLIERFHVDPHHLPIVLCPNGKLLRNPERERARPLPRPGAADRCRPSSTTWPSSAPDRPGWRPPSMRRRKACRRSCSIAAPSADRPAPRRASRTISAFPTGISGMALMARAYNQAQKFGVEMAIPDEASSCGVAADAAAPLHARCRRRRDACRARAVVMASGARYRRLDVANLAQFEGSSRALLGLADRGAALRRPGSRAGRRRQFGRPGGRLSGQPGRRRSGCWRAATSLEASMSRYLVERIEAQPNIEVLTGTEVTGAGGRRRQSRNGALAQRATGEETTRPIRHLFLFIGADPNTDWLAQCDVALDAKGFVRTGAELARAPSAGDQPQRRVRHRRRPLRLGQARRRRGRRRRPGGGGAARLSCASRQRRRCAATDRESRDGRRMQARRRRSAT